MSYSVAKVKTFLGREGHGYNCELLRDGVVVASVIDVADGGSARIDWKDRLHKKPCTVTTPRDAIITVFLPAEEADMVEFCKGKTRTICDVVLTLTPDMYIAELVDRFLMEREIRAKCKKKTCFRLKGDPGDKYRMFSVAYTVEVQELLKRRYGDNLELIYNETLFGGAR